GFGEERPHPLGDGDGGVGRSGERLADGRDPTSDQQDEVSERAPDVDADACAGWRGVSSHAGRRCRLPYVSHVIPPLCGGWGTADYSPQAVPRAGSVTGSGHDISLHLNHSIQVTDAIAWSNAFVGQSSPDSPVGPTWPVAGCSTSRARLSTAVRSLD